MQPRLMPRVARADAVLTGWLTRDTAVSTNCVAILTRLWTNSRKKLVEPRAESRVRWPAPKALTRPCGQADCPQSPSSAVPGVAITGPRFVDRGRPRPLPDPFPGNRRARPPGRQTEVPPGGRRDNLSLARSGRLSGLFGLSKPFGNWICFQYVLSFGRAITGSSTL